MGLTSAEVRSRLETAVRRAKEARFEREEQAVIPADWLRRLVLGRPLPSAKKPVVTTPFGIRIVGAEIRDRLDLDKVSPPGGGPIGPLELFDCTLAGGFSGAHAHFSRLSFRKCRFGDGEAGGGDPLPSLNLAGSTVSRDLDLREISPASARDHLWIRATGASIDGGLDLSCSELRAPPRRDKQKLSEPCPDALDLSLAELRGDFQFMNGGRCKGRINLRSAHISGDAWMTGARLEANEDECLFLQSATVDGSLLLDGRPPDIGWKGQMERFSAAGEINLLELRLGGSLDITDADVELSGERSSAADGSGICVRLIGARIDGPVRIGSREANRAGAAPAEASRIRGRLVLDRMEVMSSFTLRNVQIGVRTRDPAVPPAISARSLVARRVEFKGIEPLLWNERHADEIRPELQLLSVNLDGARVERLKIHASRFSGYLRARPLTCDRDVTLDAWIGGDIDFRGSNIGGSFDLSDLRAETGLSLRDANLGRALKFNRPPSPAGKLEKLVRARITRLRCLPDTDLIETLWRYHAGANMRVCQVAFLSKGLLIRPLNLPGALDSFVREQGHAIDKAVVAEEYLRVMGAYAVRADDRTWLVSGPDQAPPFVEFDYSLEPTDAVSADQPVQAPVPGAAPDRAGADATEIGAGPTEAGDEKPAAATEPVAAAALTAEAAAAAPVDRPGSLADLPAELFGIRYRGSGKKLTVTGCFIHHERIGRASFDVMAAKDHITVEPKFEPPLDPPLRNLPVARDLYTYHPVREGQADADPESEAKWVVPPVLGRGADARPNRLEKLNDLLLPYVQPGSSIRGVVDLTDLSCDTLDDGGGKFWGKDVRFQLDRFVYRQATWIDDLPDVDFRPWIRRQWDRIVADRIWLWLISLFGWRRSRSEFESFWSPWQVRRNWIYQQFKLKLDLPSPTRHQIQQAEYRPQPFEQAIRVARSEGREDFASSFEILKRRIEWSLFSRRSRHLLLLIGLIAAQAWLMLSGGPSLATLMPMLALLLVVLVATRPSWAAHPYLGRTLQTLLVGIIIVGAGWLISLGEHGSEDVWTFVGAILILVGLRFVSTISDWLMRNLFGYLRLPINAIASLIAAFLIGWAAVDAANDRGMLVIDVEPVASLVGRDEQRRVYVGTPRGPAGARNVACGDEIDEPLYALDVLIPLIDLRQESRCEVGRAVPFDPAEPARDRPALSAAVQWTFGPLLDSERFWEVAKAIYAIAGWFLVSLAILTFAHANRPSEER